MRTDEPTKILVRVGEVRQLFNSIDPSPFRERDLDPECEEFIVSWARELQAGRPFDIEIYVEREAMNRVAREQIPVAVQGHFRREADLQHLRLRRLIREARTSLMVGLLSLAVCSTGATYLPTLNLGPVGSVLAESLIIAGWVVMWHPLDVLLYGLWPVRREKRLLEGLAKAKVTLGGLTAAPSPAD